MYEAVTRDIRICVTPQYLEDESAPEESRYVWAYTIDISNEGQETVQLRSRHWRITDGAGRTEEDSRRKFSRVHEILPGARRI